jgi:hypothetical protein
MAIVLRADNRILTAGMPYSYLTTNYASGVSSFVVGNTDNFSANDYILIQEIGQEHCEILKINTVTAATGTIATTGASRFAHAESSRVIKIPYNQVRFFWTSSTTFDEANPVTSYSDITPDSWFSQSEDASNTSGYGWFKFKNEHTGTESGNSNPIPYANFGRNTVKSILDGFFSSINNNDLQHISMDDAMEWLNEAHDEVKDALGMANSSLDASDGTDTISLVAGTTEYALASDCGEILTVFYGSDGRMIDPIPITEVDRTDSSHYGTPVLHYYRRGSMIGFVPTVTESDTVYYRYIQTATDLNSYDDEITLPKKGFNILKDYMLYRAKDKLKQTDAIRHYEIFNSKLDILIARSFNDDGSIDSWGMVSMT